MACLGQLDLFESPGPPARGEPVVGRNLLGVRIANMHIPFKTNDIGEIKLHLQQLEQLPVAKASVGHHGGKDAVRQTGFQLGQQGALMLVALALEQGLLMGLPEQRRAATVVGLQADDQGGVVILVKLGPIHGNNDFLTLGDDVGHPIVEQVAQVELGVGQQAVDLFDGVLAVKAAGDGEAVANGMDSEGAGLEDAEGGIGEGEGALGMHILAKYVVDVLENSLVIEHGDGGRLLAGQRRGIIP